MKRLAFWIVVGIVAVNLYRGRSCARDGRDPGPVDVVARRPGLTARGPDARDRDRHREWVEGLPVPIVPETRVTEAEVEAPRTREAARSLRSITRKWTEPAEHPQDRRAALGHRAPRSRRRPRPARARGRRLARPRRPPLVEGPVEADRRDGPRHANRAGREGLRDPLRGDPAGRFLARAARQDRPGLRARAGRAAPGAARRRPRVRPGLPRRPWPATSRPTRPPRATTPTGSAWPPRRASARRAWRSTRSCDVIA